MIGIIRGLLLVQFDEHAKPLKDTTYPLLILRIDNIHRRDRPREERGPTPVRLIPLPVMREQHLDPGHAHQRLHPLQVRHRRVLVDVRAPHTPRLRVHPHRERALAREEAHVVRGVAREEQPRARARRAREHVHVPRAVARRVEHVEAAVAEEVVRAREGPYARAEVGWREDAEARGVVARDAGRDEVDAGSCCGAVEDLAAAGAEDEGGVGEGGGVSDAARGPG